MKKFSAIVRSDCFEEYEIEALTLEEAQESLEEDLCNGKFIKEVVIGRGTKGAEPINVTDIEEKKKPMKKFKVILVQEDFEEYECEANTEEEARVLMGESLSNGEFIQSANHTIWGRHRNGAIILDVEEIE